MKFFCLCLPFTQRIIHLPIEQDYICIQWFGLCHIWCENYGFSEINEFHFISKANNGTICFRMVSSGSRFFISFNSSSHRNLAHIQNTNTHTYRHTGLHRYAGTHFERWMKCCKWIRSRYAHCSVLPHLLQCNAHEPPPLHVLTSSHRNRALSFEHLTIFRHAHMHDCWSNILCIISSNERAFYVHSLAEQQMEWDRCNDKYMDIYSNIIGMKICSDAYSTFTQ